MKALIRLFAVITALCIPFSVSSNDDINADVLIGNWTSTQAHSSGTAIKIIMALNSDTTFSGTALIDDNVVWTYSGEWELKGVELTTVYTQSSMKLPDGYKDVDSILAIDGQSFSYQSSLSGKINKYTRVN